MGTTMNAAPSSISPEQLNAVMAESFALEQWRVFRQLLVTRCSVITLAIGLGGLLLGLVHSFAYWFSLGIFILAPAGAWIVERRQERGLRQKVVKSS